MSKKIKIEAVIDLNDNSFIDESLLKRTLAPLGDIIDCKINNTLSEEVIKSEKSAKSDSQTSASEIARFLNDANKIYFGTLSINERKYIAAYILHSTEIKKVNSDSQFKLKLSDSLENKFDLKKDYVTQLFDNNKDENYLENLKEKFLEGDLIQIFTYIWEKFLSIGEEDDFEAELGENAGEKFGLDKSINSDCKKVGNERAKITKAIHIIESGKVAYNKLKAFEKSVLLCLMLTECSRIDGKISQNNLKILRNIFNDHFNITSNVMTAIIEKELNYSITKKVEQVEVYREKYELVEFLWEKILTSEPEIKDDEMTLIRKWIRRLDISDVESEGARKEVEANLNP